MKNKSTTSGSAPTKGTKASPTPSKRKLLMVDDHPMMRAGLMQLINNEPDLEICHEAGNPAEALQFLSTSAVVDLVLTDITMPGRSGIEFIKDLQALRPELPVLVISMHDEGLYAERMLRAGARGYIMKEAGGEKLLVAIRQVLSGQVYVSPAMSAKILGGLSARNPRGSASPIEKLSDREFEVFRLMGQGKSAKEIATQLNLSPKTVDVHRAHIKEKLEISDAASLIHFAVCWVQTQNTGA